MGATNLANNLKQLRTQRGMSQEYLAEEAGISLRTVQRIENNESVPTGETIKRISTALEVDMNALVGTQVIQETQDLKSTLIFLKKKRSTATEKSDIKTFNSFIKLINNLIEKDLTLIQIEGVESYIKYLELDKIPSFSNELFKVKLNKFKIFLKEKLKFVPNNHYTKLGLNFAIPFIIAFTLSVSIPLTNKIIVCIGSCVFVGIGYFLDSRIKNKQRNFQF